MANHHADLTVIMKAKDLCRYVMTVTQKCPKHYRFTFTTRLQNLCMDIIENLYLANEIYIGGDNSGARFRQRLELQQKAMTQTRLLAYFSQLALEQQAILPKHYEQISLQSTEVLNFIGAWMKSDRNRFRVQQGIS